MTQCWMRWFSATADITEKAIAIFTGTSIHSQSMPYRSAPPWYLKKARAESSHCRKNWTTWTLRIMSYARRVMVHCSARHWTQIRGSAFSTWAQAPAFGPMNLLSTSPNSISASACILPASTGGTRMLWYKESISIGSSL